MPRSATGRTTGFSLRASALPAEPEDLAEAGEETGSGRRLQELNARAQGRIMGIRQATESGDEASGLDRGVEDVVGCRVVRVLFILLTLQVCQDLGQALGRFSFFVASRGTVVTELDAIAAAIAPTS